MAVLISFLIAVMAEVAGHYICKWLDSKSNNNYPIEKDGAGTPSFSLHVYMTINIFLGYLNYTMANIKVNLLS